MTRKPTHRLMLTALVVAAGAFGAAVCLGAPAYAAKAKAAPSAEAPKHDAQADVEQAGKLLASGKTEPAVAVLSDVIARGNLPAGVMARALYLRGVAYKQEAKPALAISDLTSALWLKGGLAEADRADAIKQRAAAYGEAGLTEQGQVVTGPSPKQRSKAAGEATPTPTPGSGNLFAGLFGGAPAAAPSAAAAESPSALPAAPQRRPRAKAPTPPTAEAAPAALAPTPVAATVAVARIPAPVKAPRQASGQFTSRVALVRTKAEADAVVAKLKGGYAAALGDKVADIGQTTFGSMGAFFQVGVGPYATESEAQALCHKLKGSGLDCVPVVR